MDDAGDWQAMDHAALGRVFEVVRPLSPRLTMGQNASGHTKLCDLLPQLRSDLASTRLDPIKLQVAIAVCWYGPRRAWRTEPVGAARR